ncbi:MAG TPA: HAD-IA family hydrolase [Trebonia sp.]
MTCQGLILDFGGVVVSGQGLRKPDPEIYQLTLDKLGLPGDACVFADDTAANLPPARELGLTTAHSTSDDDTATVAGLLGL